MIFLNKFSNFLLNFFTWLDYNFVFCPVTLSPTLTMKTYQALGIIHLQIDDNSIWARLRQWNPSFNHDVIWRGCGSSGEDSLLQELYGGGNHVQVGVCRNNLF